MKRIQKLLLKLRDPSSFLRRRSAELIRRADVNVRPSNGDVLLLRRR